MRRNRRGGSVAAISSGRYPARAASVSAVLAALRALATDDV